ncbi:uncharacterized protein METZ01_LOCUS485450, partial [marine metagenome]
MEAFEDKEFDLLNEAILKAIVSSPDVENVLQHFKSKDLINEMAVVNLILSLEELSRLMFPKTSTMSTQDNKYSKEKESINKQKTENQMVDKTQKITKSKANKHYLVDGNLLSRNEILFEKHYQGRFDE